jgi:hypothetical protein
MRNTLYKAVQMSVDAAESFWQKCRHNTFNWVVPATSLETGR